MGTFTWTALACMTWLAMASCASAADDAADVTVYPQVACPGYVYNVADCEVRAGGRPVPVRDYRPFGDELQTMDRNYAYAHFGIPERSVQIEVDVKEPITSWSISPKSYTIEGAVTGSKLTFALDRSRYLAVRINSRNILYILADANEIDRPAAFGVDTKSGKAVFNVGEKPYMADKTGAQLATHRLQNAIDDAAVKGGIVYVPAGIYLTHRLTMRNEVWLYLEPGAVLMPDPDRANWRTDWRPDCMILLPDTVNNKIYGRGILYCRGVELGLQAGKGDQRLRMRPMTARNAKNLVIDGILVNESTEWTIAPENCSQVRIANVKILNEKKWGTNDGIDICGGSDVAVEHCFVTTLDDAYCVKGMRGDARNIRFTDIVADTCKDGFKVGMQGMTEVADVTVTDMQVIRCYKGIDICHYYGSKDYRDIRFIDCRIERVEGKKASPVIGGSTPIRLIVHNRNDGMYRSGVASIFNIELTRVTIDDPGQNYAVFKGFDADNRVRNVTINDLRMGGRSIQGSDPILAFLDHTSDISVQGVPIPAVGSTQAAVAIDPPAGPAASPAPAQ